MVHLGTKAPLNAVFRRSPTPPDLGGPRDEICVAPTKISDLAGHRRPTDHAGAPTGRTTGRALRRTSSPWDAPPGHGLRGWSRPRHVAAATPPPSPPPSRPPAVLRATLVDVSFRDDEEGVGPSTVPLADGWCGTAAGTR